jgi:hypothetical protein
VVSCATPVSSCLFLTAAGYQNWPARVVNLRSVRFEGVLLAMHAEKADLIEDLTGLPRKIEEIPCFRYLGMMKIRCKIELHSCRKSIKGYICTKILSL